jgi:hypothetical protein
MRFEITFINLLINFIISLLKIGFSSASTNNTDNFIKINAKNLVNNSSNTHISKKTIDIINVVKDIFQKPYTTKKQRTTPKAKKCVENLKLEDKVNNFTVKNWSCKIVNQKNVKDVQPLLCSCSYDYQCDGNEKIFFSLEYNQNLLRQNKLKNVHRGADFQCENYLVKKTKKKWSCHIKNNQNATMPEEESYCDCLNKSVCKSDRLVEFY